MKSTFSFSQKSSFKDNVLNFSDVLRIATFNITRNYLNPIMYNMPKWSDAL